MPIIRRADHDDLGPLERGRAALVQYGGEDCPRAVISRARIDARTANVHLSGDRHVDRRADGLLLL